jgi:protein O-GlcNAc transferase
MRFRQTTNELISQSLVAPRPFDSDSTPHTNDHCRTALRLLERGRDLEAQIEFQRALSEDKQCVEAHYNLGLMYDRRNETHRALKHYERAVRFAPQHFDALNQLGIVYGKLGRTVEAIKTFIQAIRVKSDYVEAYGNLAMLYFNGGRYPEAINACERALKIRPDYAYTHYILGLVYVDLHYKDTALCEYQLLADLDRELASELLKAIEKEFEL